MKRSHAAVAEAVRNRHENPRYLPGFALHPSLDATTDPAAMGREIVVLAVPCQQLRGWLAANAAFFRKNVVLVNAAKGIETTNLATCAEVTEQSLGHLAPRYAALSGPSFAADVLRGLPTAVVLMIGDSQNDALAARAAGCPVALVTYGYNHGEPVRAVDADGFADRIGDLLLA